MALTLIEPATAMPVATMIVGIRACAALKSVDFSTAYIRSPNKRAAAHPPICPPMIIDARSVPAGTVLETAVCIIGAGAAGITLAREFIGSRFETLLLESGGLEFAADTQDLYQGAIVGRPFEDLTACRLRFFGGTTN